MSILNNRAFGLVYPLPTRPTTQQTRYYLYSIPVSRLGMASTKHGMRRSVCSRISIRVLHPRGGGPGDGERDAVIAEIVSEWHRKDVQESYSSAAIADPPLGSGLMLYYMLLFVVVVVVEVGAAVVHSDFFSRVSFCKYRSD